MKDQKTIWTGQKFAGRPRRSEFVEKYIYFFYYTIIAYDTR